MIVTSSDNCLNVILEIEKPLQRGANQDIKRVIRRPGGNALVTAMALARWGMQSAFLGAIGDDIEGGILRNWMQAVGVDTSGIIRTVQTRISYVIMDDSDRTILDQREQSSLPAGLQAADWESTSSIARLIEPADAIMLDRYSAVIHEQVKQVIRKRQEQGKKPFLAYRTGSRPSPDLGVEAGILPFADVAFTKDVYLAQAGGGKSPMEGCRWLSERFSVPLVVATTGAEGAAYYNFSNGTAGTVPALPVAKPLTTLGGGDFFRAGFLLSFLEGRSFLESIRSGHAAAAEHFRRKESEDVEEMFFTRAEIISNSF